MNGASTMMTTTTKTDDEDKVVIPLEQQTRRPLDTDLRQQRIRAWYPILDPWWVIAGLVVFGAAFIPAGLKIMSMSADLVELVKEYDSFDVMHPCSIQLQANANKVCFVEFTVEEEMEPPILLHYQLENFYQNHRKYINSRDDYQLAGAITQTSLQAQKCEPLNIINGTRINPCGLIANTLFNDIISLDSAMTETNGTETIIDMDLLETGIAWQSDLEFRYKQPTGFEAELCPDQENVTNCCTIGTTSTGNAWSCVTPHLYSDDQYWRYYYPEDDTTLYAYETYPSIFNPIDGIQNEHFAVWMRVATLPTFRKLYGWIDQTIPANTTLRFRIEANFEVTSFEGRKSLILSTNNILGGANTWLGMIFLGVGGFSLLAAIFFALKQTIRPRRIGDKRYLAYKED